MASFLKKDKPQGGLSGRRHRDLGEGDSKEGWMPGELCTGTHLCWQGLPEARVMNPLAAWTTESQYLLWGTLT